MTAAPKILQISHDYGGPFVGVCRDIVDALPDCEVTTVYLQGADDADVTERTAGHQVIYLGEGLTNLRGFKFRSLLRLFQVLRQSRFDGVVAHRYKSIYLAGVMSFLFSFGPLIGVIHEHNVLKRKTRSLFLTFWRRNIHIVAVSDSVKNSVLRYCPQLEPEGRIHVLPHGIKLSREQELLSPAEARRKLNLPQDAFIYGAVGRLVAKKNFALLLAGFAKLSHSDSQLVVVGDGHLRDSLQRTATQLGIQDRVHFVGHVDQAFSIYRAFDVFVMTSDAREAFGIVLLEAMLAKVPVVCSHVPGPLEVVADTALTFQPQSADALADSLTKVLDAELRSALAEKAHARLKAHYSMEQFKTRFRQLEPWRGLLWQ